VVAKLFNIVQPDVAVRAGSLSALF